MSRSKTSTGSKFSLVTLASKRARQINAYFNQLGEGIGAYVPPQVHSLSRQPVTIAFEEIIDEPALEIVDPVDAIFASDAEAVLGELLSGV